MWARHMELSLGIWLLISPFVFHPEASRPFLWIHDLSVGAAVVSLALAAHWRPLHRIHLLFAPLALWLMGLGWWGAWQEEGIHVDPVHQNWLLVGLLLILFAIVPSESSQRPIPWRRGSGAARGRRSPGTSQGTPSAGPQGSRSPGSDERSPS
ncbi:MAG: SPW repeat domain-containing protein [bacterium]